MQWTQPTVILGVFICGCTLFGLLIPRSVVLVPGESLFTPWTLVTCQFVLDSTISCISVLLLLLSHLYFERIWTAKELAEMDLVSTIAILPTLLTLEVQYFTLGHDGLLFDSLSGPIALTAGYLVAFKQQVPEHKLTLFQVFSIRTKHVGSLILCILTIFNILNTTLFNEFSSTLNGAYFLYLYGMIVSWIYLRFFKWRDGIKGDRSEAFSFISFLPEFTHAFLKPISNSIYSYMVKLGIMTPIQPGRFTPLDEPAVVRPVLVPGSEESERERKRALGLKALESKIHSNSK